MKPALVLAFALVLAAGCSHREGRELGAAIHGNPISIAALKQSQGNPTVVLAGTITRKCPVAGCWFTLDDGTGTIQVDTKNSGFVVLDVPLKSRLLVTGHLVSSDTGGRSLDATGIRY